MTAQFNPDVRDLYEEIVKRNVIHNPRDNFDYMPERYGGSRVRDMALSGNDGHFPSNEQIIHSNMGGFYGRASHPIAVGSGRRCGGVGVLKQARVEPFVNELDQDYMPVSASHGAGRAPRLTNAVKQRILEMHPELMQHHLSGGAIPWAKIWKGIKDTASFVSKAAPVAAQLAGPEYSDTIGKVGDISGKISGLGRGGNFSHMLAIDLARRAMSKKKGGMKKMIFGESAASKARREVRETRREGSERNIRTQQANQAALEAAQRHNAEVAFESEVNRLRSQEKAREGKPLTMAEAYLKERKELKSGRGFWQDFGTGFRTGMKQTAKYAAPALGIASIFQPELLPLAAATGVASKAMGNGRRMTLPKSGHKREVARGDIVAAIMRQRGVGLGEASRIVKQEGLY